VAHMAWLAMFITCAALWSLHVVQNSKKCCMACCLTIEGKRQPALHRLCPVSDLERAASILRHSSAVFPKPDLVSGPHHYGHYVLRTYVCDNLPHVFRPPGCQRWRRET
jgi:hypothetical protein